jgi:hypothetical protein
VKEILMANPEHLEILNRGIEVWNRWRNQNPYIRPDLNKANLRGKILRKADLRRAYIIEAKLRKANLIGADLRGTYLNGAELIEAELMKANLRGANLSHANLSQADLMAADLREAILRKTYLGGTILDMADLSGLDLSGTTLTGASLNETILKGTNLENSILNYAHIIETNLENTNLTGCQVYGCSVWGIKLNEAIQKNIIITPEGEPTITVDNLEVAQFIYLLLHNEKIRDIIDTITSKVVLILGRFTPERKSILEAIREELRKKDYLPVLFDFEGPTSRDISETISTLAHMARFVIADITDAKSIPQELQAIVPNLPSVPVQPLLQSSKDEYGMFEHFKSYPWVLSIHRYSDFEDLMATLKENVIAPAEAKVIELRSKC